MEKLTITTSYIVPPVLNKPIKLIFSFIVVVPAFLALFLCLIGAVQGGRSVDFPPKIISLDWILKIALSQRWRDHYFDSFTIGLISGIVALILGVPGAIGLKLLSPKIKQWALQIILYPLMIPPLLLAVGWYYPSHILGMFDTRWGIGILQAAVGVSFVCFPVLQALERLERSFWQAALNSGASPWRINFGLALHAIYPSIIVGTSLVFLFSLNEVAFALYLSELNANPIVQGLWNGVRFEFSPEVFAAVIWLLFIETVIIIFLAFFVLKLNPPKGESDNE